jgi:hypothetical protein
VENYRCNGSRAHVVLLEKQPEVVAKGEDPPRRLANLNDTTTYRQAARLMQDLFRDD